MADGRVNLVCYWNGKMVNGPQGISYEGASPMPLKLSSKIKFDELLDKMYEITGFDKAECQLKITCRFPTTREYIPVPILNDEAVQIIMDVAKQPGTFCVELYLDRVEIVPACISTQADVLPFNSSFIQLHTQGSDSVLHSPLTHEGEIGGTSNYELESERHNFDTQEYGVMPNANSMDEGGVGLGHGRTVNHLRSPININAIPEIMAAEGYTFVAENTDVNNNLVDDDEEEEVCEETRQQETAVAYEEAPAPDFTNVDWANDAVVSQWVPWQHDRGQTEAGEFYVGQRFQTKGQLQIEVKSYSMRTHHQYVVKNSNTSLLVLKCKKSEICSWILRASKIKGGDGFEIRTYKGPHTCVYPIINRDHLQLDSGFIADHIQSLVKAQISITVAAIQSVVSDRFNYCISYKKAWKAKQKAIVKIFGGWKESYEFLPKYMAELKEQNPGTIVIWQKNPGRRPNEEIFSRVFWAFGPSIEGFKYCRPVISIDGTHLYGKYKGTMLIVVGTDANNQLFPLAFAIAEGENIDSWSWFMGCIRSHVTKEREGLCVISDRHIGILTTMNSDVSGWNEPHAYHRICMRHLASNFNTHYHDKTLKSLICKAAKAHQIRKFNKIMTSIEKHNSEARKKLDEIPVEKWALAHDGGRRYGIMTTNLSEIFNSVLKGARSLPITACVQLTFYRVNSYFTLRRQWAEEREVAGKNFTPYIDIKLSAYMIKANAHEVVLFDHLRGTFSVRTGRVSGSTNKGGHTQNINLQNRTCTCQKFHLYGFPCSHVVAGCQSRSLDYLYLVQNWYHIRAYAQTWEPRFHPLRDRSYWSTWEGSTLLPCEFMKRTKKGRPTSTRLRNEMDIKEGRTSVTCGLCKLKGHNRRKCPNKNHQNW